ncbi:MAG: hypothetical protein IPO85_12345 [Saprospiraceae bacterium]|uniref:Uncharacterized protein n=1 Tax=Candidatus Defluviibacterium haderslevense TaxID=2981993 RepID=A0A9D7S966_9BACT|nr:hypothetical protein [Candidatus Defluviibacterium haderslevense]
MKKFNLKKITDTAIPVATATVGFGLAKVVNKIDMLQKNPTYSGIAQLGLGIFMSTMKNKHIQNLGFGVAMAGAHSFLATPINDALAKAGITGLGYVSYPGRYASNSQVNGIGCPTEVMY